MLEIFKQKLKRIKIEPYGNENQTKQLQGLYGFIIKIEPYWNVNGRASAKSTHIAIIKIEPYWNVNS